MNRESAIRKLRALLARGDAAKNDNEHERATAMRQARAIMDRFGLEEHDADTDDDFRGALDSEQFEVSSYAWERELLHAVARLYDCKSYNTRVWRGASKRRVPVIVGREVNRTTVAIIARYLIDSITREGKATKPSYEHGKQWMNSFGSGAAWAIGDRVDVMLAEREEMARAERGRALMVLSQSMALQEEASQWIAQHVGRLVRGPGRTVNLAGYNAGQAFGQGLPLTKNVRPARRGIGHG
jgi:hypothetical protein